MDTFYDGTLGYPYSFTFTPLTGPSFGSAQIQVEKVSTPKMKRNKPTFTPISGANAGIEQFVIANAPIQEYAITWTYIKSAYVAALAAFTNGIKGTLAATYSDGTVQSWVGAGVTGISDGDVDGSALRTGMIEFTVPASPAVV